MLKFGCKVRFCRGVCPPRWRPVLFVQRFCRRFGKDLAGKGSGRFWLPRDVVGLRATATIWNVLGKYGPHGELFFFPIKKEPVVLRERVDSGPCITAEMLKACALIGLHMMAEENASLSNGDFSPG